MISTEITYKCSESDSAKLISHEFEPYPLLEKKNFTAFLLVDITEEISCDAQIFIKLTRAENCILKKVPVFNLNIGVKKALLDFPQDSIEDSCSDDDLMTDEDEEVIKPGRVRIKLNLPLKFPKGCFGGELKVKAAIDGKEYFSCIGDGYEVVG